MKLYLSENTNTISGIPVPPSSTLHRPGLLEGDPSLSPSCTRPQEVTQVESSVRFRTGSISGTTEKTSYEIRMDGSFSEPPSPQPSEVPPKVRRPLRGRVDRGDSDVYVSNPNNVWVVTRRLGFLPPSYVGSSDVETKVGTVPRS